MRNAIDQRRYAFDQYLTLCAVCLILCSISKCAGQKVDCAAHLADRALHFTSMQRYLNVLNWSNVQKSFVKHAVQFVNHCAFLQLVKHAANWSIVQIGYAA